MSLQQRQTSSVKQVGERNDSEMRLQGPWLLIARISWVTLTLLILTLNVVMIPRYNAALLSHCQPGPHCYALILTTSDQELLHQFGISLGFVAAYRVMLDTVSVLVCCALGALLFWRKSANRMALFCAFMLVLFGGAGFSGILQETLAPLSTVWFALVGALDLLGQCSFMIFFFLFPTGRFVPRWTRWIVPCIVLYWIYAIFLANEYRNFTWPDLVFVALLLCILGAQVYRYRRVSTSRERLQTKWVVFGFSIGIIGFILFLVLANIGGIFLQPSNVFKALVGGTIIYGFLLLIPISIAIAVLRSRLYDIDVIINRALVYGLLTALLAAVYAGLIIGLTTLAGIITGRAFSNPFALVVSTLAIYALFQPLRSRIQQVIDRRFYRRKYDAARTLEAFSATLRNEVDLASLSEHLVAVVQETMQPASISLWLRPPTLEHIPWSVTPSISSESEIRDER
jgi:hypothetical protein